MPRSPTRPIVSSTTPSSVAHLALPLKPATPFELPSRDTSTSARPISQSPSLSPPKRNIDTYFPEPHSRDHDLRRRTSSAQSPDFYWSSSRLSSHGDSYSRRGYSTSRSPEKRPTGDHYSPPTSPNRSYRTISRSRSRRETPDRDQSGRLRDIRVQTSTYTKRPQLGHPSPEKRSLPLEDEEVYSKRVKTSHESTTSQDQSLSDRVPLSFTAQIASTLPDDRGADQFGQVRDLRDRISQPPSETSLDRKAANNEMTAKRGRGRGRGKSAGVGRAAANAATPAAGNTLQPPVYDHDFIMASYGRGPPLKQQWVDNPKSPLANHVSNSMKLKYVQTSGVIGGKKLFRVTVLADAATGITGIGDAAAAKEAEKLAALSAVMQLHAAGLLEMSQKGSAPGPSASGLSTSGGGGGGETVALSDGSSISYDRARQFMDYYCQRYNFPKPDLEFSQSTVRTGKKKGGNSKWEAVLKVGGRVIGMGEAGTKKAAQVKTYLDVTQYLEGCDPALWKDFNDFSQKDPMKDLGLAPHLVFQMSDTVNEDVQALTDDIRQSTLFKNAPSSGVAADTQALPSWRSGGRRRATAEELAQKSQTLQDRLLDYHSDPKLDKMRKQRDSLPIKVRATDILTKVQLNDVTIIMAATGSGKTTQVPQLLFDNYINKGDGANCNILCTQPRRLAAMSVAERIADERGQRLGNEVGYQVRFDNRLPEADGSITFCTTGIFLKRMQSALGANADPEAIAQMDKVTHIVVDEVHERDIDTDLSLVVLKRLLADRKARKRPLKVILMSATIDPTLFKEYFPDDRGRPAPVVEVPGRTFPVERHYLNDIMPELQSEARGSSSWVFQEKSVNDYLTREMQPDKSAFSPITGMDLEIPYPLVALTIAYVMNRSDDGHVLVFLPGLEEIKKVANILLDSSGRLSLMNTRFSDPSKFSIHYLHSSIPAAEQKEVFNPPPKGVRRIILATNIAETSITIPDVVYVVDAARVKEKRYDPERHMSSLVAAWVGSSNLNQRAGRAGRHREGEYFGLLSQNRYNALETHQTVEMKRSDLSNVVMHVKALNLGEVEDVMAAVIEPPEPSRIVAAMDTLRMLGALDAEKNLTSLGRVLLQLPVEAAIGKLCLYGSFFRCLDSALTLAAILTNRDPFLAPLEMKKEADEIKDSWSPSAFRSDPLAIWAAYNEWVQYDDSGQYHRGSKFCQANFLAKTTLLQIKQVKSSLLQSLDQAGVIAVSAGGNVRRIGRRTEVPRELNENGGSLPLLAGLIALASAPNFALRTSEKACRTSQDKTVFIHQSSVNARRRETGGPEMPSASFNPAEKRLYAFTEKSRSIPLGSKGGGATTYLRNVSRIDGLLYMLFGAYNLVVTRRGIESDGWLPITGDLYSLDDIQRLKVLFERCMLRVFEGLGKSLLKGRDDRRRDTRAKIHVGKSSSRIEDNNEDDNEDGEEEGESDDEGQGNYQPDKPSRQSGPLLPEEVKELQLLTTDIVKVLETYANEREGGSVAVSRPVTPGLGPGHGPRANGNNGGGGANGGAYRPPGRR